MNVMLSGLKRNKKFLTTPFQQLMTNLMQENNRGDVGSEENQH